MAPSNHLTISFFGRQINKHPFPSTIHKSVQIFDFPIKHHINLDPGINIECIFIHQQPTRVYISTGFFLYYRKMNNKVCTRLDKWILFDQIARWLWVQRGTWSLDITYWYKYILWYKVIYSFCICQKMVHRYWLSINVVYWEPPPESTIDSLCQCQVYFI